MHPFDRATGSPFWISLILQTPHESTSLYRPPTGWQSILHIQFSRILDPTHSLFFYDYFLIIYFPFFIYSCLNCNIGCRLKNLIELGLIVICTYVPTLNNITLLTYNISSIVKR